MAHVSPTAEGFRAAFRRPSLTFAEIAWRWTVGATAWALALFWVFEYLNTLPVSKSDAALLATRQPALAGRAISHILHGSLNRAVLAALFAALALALLWILAASIGRAATVRALLDYFHNNNNNDVEGNVPTETGGVLRPGAFRSLIGLNFLRVTVMLSAVLALFGAAIMSGLASRAANSRLGLVFLLFLPLGGLICTVWAGLTWLIALAGIFAVRDGEDVLGAVAVAVTFCRNRTAAVFAVSIWTGLAHFVVFSVALTAASLPLSLIQFAPSRLVIACIILVILVYFIAVDWLYMARLAGYVCTAEMPEALPLAAIPSADPPASPRFAPGPPAQAAVDRDELILGDLPNLALET